MNLGEFLLWSIEVFFLIMVFWIFIAIFSDIFRRTDIHGGMKAVWILVIVVLPFLGCLIYIVARPKVTPGDVTMMVQAEAANKAAAGVSNRGRARQTGALLKDAGTITAAQYQDLKVKAIAAS